MSSPLWQHLFGSGQPGARTVPVRVFTRGGHPLLVIFPHPCLSPHYATSLYAPQTLVARLARWIWKWSIPFGSVPGSYSQTIAVADSSPFLKFLCSFTDPGMFSGDPPKLPVSMLLSNPHAPPRLVIQVYGRSGIPRAVVKAGLDHEAAVLIEREANFLHVAQSETIPGKLVLPQILGRFQMGEVCAFAMPYIEGHSPRRQDTGQIRNTLSSWLYTDVQAQVSTLPAWQTLTRTAAQGDAFRRIEQLAKLRIHPALFHGDFAPWNVKLSGKNCTVLDWERADRMGPPAWDYFHYELQPAILVQRKTGNALLQVAENVLASEWVRAYCMKAGLAGNERDWMRAYLIFCEQVLKTKENASEIARTLSHLRESL